MVRTPLMTRSSRTACATVVKSDIPARLSRVRFDGLALQSSWVIGPALTGRTSFAETDRKPAWVRPRAGRMLLHLGADGSASARSGAAGDARGEENHRR